jgi:hypothetical protein
MDNIKDLRNEFIEAAKRKTSGCPLFEGREKGDLADMEGMELTLERAWPLTGDDGEYFAVWFEEAPEHFFLSSTALTAVINEGVTIAEREGKDLDEIIAGVVIKVCEPRKTKNGRKYRPVEVVG